LESPGLWGWLNCGTSSEWWVVCVRSDTCVRLACLDGELVTVSLDLLGSTTAESFTAYSSGHDTIDVSYLGTWGVGSTTGSECGLRIVGFFDCVSLSSIGDCFSVLFFKGFLGSFVTGSLACGNSGGFVNSPLGDCKIGCRDGVGVCGDRVLDQLHSPVLDREISLGIDNSGFGCGEGCCSGILNC